MTTCLLLLALQQPAAPAGFRVEELYRASKDEGSWICMAFDPEGRITVSAETGPLRRVTLGETVRVEAVEPRLKTAMGLLHAHGALYANADGPQGVGLVHTSPLSRPS